MGLTISYKLETQRKLNLAAVGELIGKLRAKAIELGFEEVSEMIAVAPRHSWLYYRPPWAKKASELVPAHDGWFFVATPGDGSEIMTVGLCRFAGAAGWRLEAFCKTQYASRHGWEHFLKCHRGVIELLWAAEAAGLRVKVDDEGGLWETGSHKVLRRNLAEYNQCVAALGGALKDADESGKNVVSPIFNHPQFEQLEATGLACHGAKISKAVRLVKRLAASQL